MPKHFTYRAVTANCGNDSIGQVASEQIVNCLFTKDKSVDFLIVNCQEVHFEKTKLQFESLIKDKGYRIQCLAKMPTHTKAATQLHHATGIASYIIHKSELAIKLDAEKVVRRGTVRFTGNAFNKGGVVAEFTVTHDEGKAEERIKIQAISGHLNSTSDEKRIQDWANLHQAISKAKVNSWDDLVAACFDLKISGYDANTRNKIENDTVINLMLDRPDDPEVQALYRAPLADRHFTSHITYSKLSNKKNKRPGYAAEGMLDFVGISDGSEDSGKRIVTQGVIKVGLEESTQRDHMVIISPMQEYTPKSEFDRVKGQIASSLHYVAPKLAKELRHLQEKSGDFGKNRLMEVFNIYLSTSGLLNKSIALQKSKLKIYRKLFISDFLKDESVKKRLFQVLFNTTDWCEGIPGSVQAKRRLMHVLIKSLSHCKRKSGISERLNWYLEMDSKTTQYPENSEREFKERVINEFYQARNKFARSLNLYDHKNDELQKTLYTIGINALKTLDGVANSDVLNKRHLNEKNLDQLTRIFEVFSEAFAPDNSKETQVQILENLVKLSGESQGKFSKIKSVIDSVINALSRIITRAFGMKSGKVINSNREEGDEDIRSSYTSVLDKLNKKLKTTLEKNPVHDKNPQRVQDEKDEAYETDNESLTEESDEDHQDNQFNSPKI